MDDNFFPLADEYDHAIIMHCKAHFGGSFAIMMEYYANEGKGAMPEFELYRIRALAALEEENPGFLEEMLSPPEMAEIEKSRALYNKLRSVYEDARSAPIARALADLILAEDEEPAKEIDAIARLGKDAVDPLIALVSSEDYYNPLFPGYSYAPASAALALGKIGDPRAVAPLFQALGKEDFFTEAAIIDALGMLGDASRTFLLSRLRHQPLTKENTQAAIALASFKDHPDVVSASLDLLEKTACDPRYKDLAAYLILNCAHTSIPEERKRLEELANNPSFPPTLQEELRLFR